MRAWHLHVEPNRDEALGFHGHSYNENLAGAIIISLIPEHHDGRPVINKVSIEIRLQFYHHIGQSHDDAIVDRPLA